MEDLAIIDPLISCVLPVYNGDAFLADAINSILRQTHENFELIIINDGSTDKTGAIIASFRDPRIRVECQRNAGIVSALNRGLSLARGDFIARMDADDISLPDRFEKQVRFLIENPDVVLVGGRSIPITSEGFIDEYKISRKNLKHEKRKGADFRTFPPRVATALHPLIMMRSTAIRAIGGYRHGFDYAEDYDMYIRISQYGSLHNIDDVILQYRYHGENISTRKTFDQEKNAARSEIDNMKNLSCIAQYKPGVMQYKHCKISENTFDGYVHLRTFRREIGLGISSYDRALTALKFILLGMAGSEIRISIRLFLMWLYNTERYFLVAIRRRIHQRYNNLSA